MRHILQSTQKASSSSSNKNNVKEPVSVYRYHHDSDVRLKALISSDSIKQNRILYKAHSVFPFDLFPDTLIIDENKVSVYVSDFFPMTTLSSITSKKKMHFVREGSYKVL